MNNLSECPVEITMSLIDERWKVLIIRELLTGTKRFGELKNALPNISSKVLTTKLRAMEKNGLIHRKIYAQVPPKVEYKLTPIGISLKPILDSMVIWGLSYKEKMTILE
jgi:Predicted transcriptional regulators